MGKWLVERALRRGARETGEEREEPGKAEGSARVWPQPEPTGSPGAWRPFSNELGLLYLCQVVISCRLPPVGG